MNSQILRSIRLIWFVALLLFKTQVSQGGQTCAGTSPRVCVQRDDITPDEGTDFTFDIVTDSDNPDVTFKTGHNTNSWRVWSQVSALDTTPANLGDLAIDSSGTTDNFRVEIRNPNNGNPGAVHLNSAVLKDGTNWTGYSTIAAGSQITGDLNGNLEVVASGGSGGTGDLTVAGSILGNVTMSVIPNGAAFEVGQDLAAGSVLNVTTVLGTVEIGGDLLGQVAVIQLQSGGLINLVKGVGEDATVDVVMHPGAAIYVNSDRFEEGPIAPFAGAMRLAGGVPQLAQVNVAGGMAATGTIDLDGGDVVGQLTVRGGSGIIYNGGVVTGYDPVFGLLGVFLGFEDDVFSGTATFTGVTGIIEFRDGASLDGTIEITGDVEGQILVQSDSSLQGAHVHSNGQVIVRGDVSGRIGIDGNLAGQVLIQGEPTHVPDIYGQTGVGVGGDLVDGGLLSISGDSTTFIYVRGDVAGRVEVGGNLAYPDSETPAFWTDGSILAGGELVVGGDTTGVIHVEGDLEGDIRVDGGIVAENAPNGHSAVGIVGNMSGQVIANADGVSGGSISGGVTVVEQFDGNICGENLDVGGPWPLPSNIAIPNFACTGRICGYGPLVEMPGTNVEAKGGRYIATTLDLPEFSQCAVALFLAAYREPGGLCIGAYVQADGTIGPSPIYRSASEWATTVIADEEILPGTDYTVWAEFGSGGGFSAPAMISTWIWGDVNNSAAVDVDDITCMLGAFSGVCGGAGCICTLHAHDLAPCIPNGIIDVDDILRELDAFSNVSYSVDCPDPCAGTAPATGGGIGLQCLYVTVTLSAPPGSIEAGSTVDVTVTGSCSSAIRAYQMGLEVSGGSAGTLTLESVDIDTARSDYLFAGQSAIDASDMAQARAVAARYSGGSNANPAKYLATFTYRASNDAAGNFLIQAKAANTHFRRGNNQAVTWNAGSGITVNVR